MASLVCELLCNLNIASSQGPIDQLCCSFLVTLYTLSVTQENAWIVRRFGETVLSGALVLTIARITTGEKKNNGGGNQPNSN